MSGANFWEVKTLEEMTTEEWESLCDGCGLCCIVRVENENNGDIYDTNVICTHYDCDKKQCSSYTARTKLADGCVQLTPELLSLFDWLPDSCAYVRHSNGLPLLQGHPLLQKDSGKVEAEEVQIINVVDKYQSMGLIKNGPDVIPEHHFVFPDQLEASGDS